MTLDLLCCYRTYIKFQKKKGCKMNAKETIKTWRYRIVKANLNASQFGEMIGVSSSLLSQYMGGKISPSLENFDLIESKLKELGV